MTRSHAGSSALRAAEALADAAAVVARRIPAPRGLPFFGLDHPSGVLDRVLAALSDLGIFRHYSHVLDATGGLGGPARWLARRHGCRVTAVEREPAIAAASSLLTMRSFLVERVSTVVAEIDDLSLPDEAFTHAWRVTGAPASAATLHELGRVLRPGGWLALAERATEAAATVAALQAAGYRQVTRLDLDPLVEDDSTAARLVAERAEAAVGTPFVRAGVAAPLSLVGLRARKPS